MAQSATKPSTPRLSEVARHLVYPAGIVSSGWPRIEHRLSEMAISYDTWQSGAVRLILGRDAADRYASTVGGVTMSIPRQVGKTFTIGSLLIAMCIEYPGLRVVWTSHHLRTTTNTFRAMQGMVRRKKVAPYLAHNGIRTANGEQEIKFANGSIIMFGARERGFGVGIDAIDVLVCDEAQRLSSRSLADMVPTTNQARHPHGALLFFIGTPPRPTDVGDEFSSRRKKALDGRMTNGVYIELSADANTALDDPEQWRKANPSYPHRTPHESMLRMRENLTDDDDWRREALGIWDIAERVQIMPNWMACGDADLEPPAPASIGIAVSIDRAWSSIGVSSAGDPAHLGSHKRARGTDWVVAEAVRIHATYGIHPVIAGRGPGASLIQPLTDAGLEPIVAGIDDYQDACAELFDHVEAGTVTHGHYDDLNEAVSVAGWTAGERRVWTRKSGDASMLEAVTLAKWGANQTTEYDPLESIY